MWQPRQDLDVDENGTTHSMGLTLLLREHDGRRFVGHTGGQKAFVSFCYIDPDKAV